MPIRHKGIFLGILACPLAVAEMAKQTDLRLWFKKKEVSRPEFDTLGQPSGKFDYYVRYTGPDIEGMQVEDVKPTGWDLNEVPLKDDANKQDVLPEHVFKAVPCILKKRPVGRPRKRLMTHAEYTYNRDYWWLQWRKSPKGVEVYGPVEDPEDLIPPWCK